MPHTQYNVELSQERVRERARLLGEVAIYVGAGFDSTGLHDLVNSATVCAPSLGDTDALFDRTLTVNSKGVEQLDTTSSVGFTEGDALVGIVFYQSLESRTANMIQLGSMGDAVVTDWVEEAGKILVEHQKCREKVLLVDGDAALDDFPKLISTLNSYFGLEFRFKGFEEISFERPSALTLQIAKQYLGNFSEALRIDGELEASSPISSRKFRSSPTELLAEYQEIIVSDRSRRAEFVDLEHRLHLMEEQYELEYFRAKKLIQLIADERSRMSKTEIGEDRFLGDQSLEGASDEELLAKRLADVYASQSWRITAPFRFIGKLLRRSSGPRSNALEVDMLDTRSESEILAQRLEATYASWSWRVTAPLRSGLDFLKNTFKRRSHEEAS